jgi:Cu(I)/Ag(I) efflux system membrane fusion protein
MGDSYTILDGLESGEQVVINGAFVIDAAAQLNNQASMMNRNVRRTGMESAGPDYTQQTPQAFRQQLGNVVLSYLALKDALVNTNMADARQEADVLIGLLDNVDMLLLQDQAHAYWMQKLDALSSHGNAITASDDIEVQRRQFSFLTIALVEALSAFGTSGDTLYLQHCPMAFDNTGADWLSDQRVIRNPYFGDKMLTCGSVKQTFPLERQPPGAQNPTGRTHQH